jgi:hypothetical protein
MEWSVSAYLSLLKVFISQSCWDHGGWRFGSKSHNDACGLTSRVIPMIRVDQLISYIASLSWNCALEEYPNDKQTSLVATC